MATSVLASRSAWWRGALIRCLQAAAADFPVPVVNLDEAVWLKCPQCGREALSTEWPEIAGRIGPGGIEDVPCCPVCLDDHRFVVEPRALDWEDGA